MMIAISAMVFQRDLRMEEKEIEQIFERYENFLIKVRQISILWRFARLDLYIYRTTILSIFTLSSLSYQCLLQCLSVDSVGCLQAVT